MYKNVFSFWVLFYYTLLEIDFTQVTTSKSIEFDQNICVHNPGESSSKTTFISMPASAHLACTSSRSCRQDFRSLLSIIRMAMRLMWGVWDSKSFSRYWTISKSCFWLHYGLDPSSEQSRWRYSSCSVLGRSSPTWSAASGSDPRSSVIGTSTEESLKNCFRNP